MMGRRFVSVVVALGSLLAWQADAVGTTWDLAPSEGLAYMPTEAGDVVIPAAVGFTSTSSQTIDSITLPLGVTGDDARLQVEIYEAGDEVPTGGVSSQLYRPVDDLQIGGDDSQDNAWLKPGFPPTDNNIYQALNGSTVDPAVYTYYGAETATQGNAKRYRALLGTSAWPANRRVMGGTLSVVANREESAGRLQVAYYDGTTAHVLQTITVTNERQRFNIRWPAVNPATGYPWTQAQIVALSSTAAIQLRPVNVNRNRPLRVFQLYLNLNYITENRLAVGVVEAEPQDPAAPTTFLLRRPNSGADNWPKANSTDYTVLLKRTGGFGVTSWRQVTQTAAVAEALLRPDAQVGNPVISYVPLLDDNGNISVLGEGVPGRAQAFWLTNTSAAISADGQPYQGFVGQFVTSASGAAQTLSPSVTGTYSLLRMLVVPMQSSANGLRYSNPSDISTLASLSVKVKLESTDVQVGSTSTVTAAEVAAATAVPVTLSERVAGTLILDPDVDGPVTAYVVSVPLTGVTLTASTLYYAEVTTTQPPPGANDLVWQVLQAAFPTDPPNLATPSYGGDVDAAYTSAGGTLTAIESGDLPLTISTQPTAPTGLDADTVEADTQAADLDGTGCTIPSTQVVDLDWTPTSLDDDFGCYQIERQNGDTTPIIYQGDEEAADRVVDWEAPYGSLSTYRIRAIRNGDWVPSAWSNTATATVEPYGAETVFASNWLQAAAGVNREPEITWPQPNNDRVLQLSGRDYQQVFQEPENRGDGGTDGFTIDVVGYIGGGTAPLVPTPPGREFWAPLRDYLRDYCPYLAVKDWTGDVWYGRATLTEMGEDYGDDGTALYRGQIQVVQTQAEPTPVSIPAVGS